MHSSIHLVKTNNQLKKWKGEVVLRYLLLSVLMFVMLTTTWTSAALQANARLSDYRQQEEIALIFEVAEDANVQADYIRKHYPKLHVVATYSLLFNGVAVKGPAVEMDKLMQQAFVKGIHPVYTYEATAVELGPISVTIDDIFPHRTGETHQYTGKGVKVGVIDTGMDYTHPDLVRNYRGGYDLVDLDDDPMETTPEQGMPTLHGTHVAGIIAANGEMKGVAPDAEIHAYRALGPGGMGTSIQVIAAMEQAVSDGMDIINLSLGNTVNGPDYPTSQAVDAASTLGVAVIVANGNAGPDDWTIGSPATATHSLAVGAYEASTEKPYLYNRKYDKKMEIAALHNAPTWKMDRGYQLAPFQASNYKGKIVIIKATGDTLIEKINQAKDKGARAVLLYQTKQQEELQSVLTATQFPVPVAFISAENAHWLLENRDQYIDTKQEELPEAVTDFSSRGPVTMSWQIKPDLLAPGANIVSTVPGGYEALSGTSMATPYIAGVIALMKEAHPDWSNEQLFGALKTTARKLMDTGGTLVNPNIQGSGLVNIKAAIETETIITHPQLAFGKIAHWMETKYIAVEIENISTKDKDYHFDIPKQEKGLSWTLPKSFTLAPGEKKVLQIGLKIGAGQLAEGMHQDWLALKTGDDTFLLPYLFINQTADYPKIMGFSFQVNPFDQDTYAYELFLPENVRQVQVQLYDPDTHLFQGVLYKWKDLKEGMHKGEILRRRIKQRGYFYGLIIVQLENGEIASYQTEIELP